MPVITDPRQNQHMWCGILRSTEETNGLLANQDYVFFKTYREAHFITQGTLVNKFSVWEASQVQVELDKFVGKFFKGNAELLERMKHDLSECQRQVGDKCKVIIIEGIDKAETSPLCNEINDIVGEKFINPEWLDKDSERKGSAAIRLGMSLPSWG